MDNKSKNRIVLLNSNSQEGLDSSLNDLSINKSKLESLRLEVSTDSKINMCFIVMGFGILASQNAVLTALEWVDNDIQNYDVLSNTVSIYQFSVLISSILVIFFKQNNQQVMGLSQLVMGLSVFLVPILIVLMRDCDDGLKFGCWVVLQVANGLASGVNQTIAFSFSSTVGNQANANTSIGMPFGGMIVSLLCVIFNYGLNSDEEIFGFMLSKEDVSNSIQFSFAALFLVINQVVSLQLINHPKISEIQRISKIINNEENDVCEGDQDHYADKRNFRKIQKQVFLMCLTMACTFMLQPTILFDNQKQAKFENKENRLFQTDLDFTIFVVLTYNLFDQLGRSLVLIRSFNIGLGQHYIIILIRIAMVIIGIVGIQNSWFGQDLELLGLTALLGLTQGQSCTLLQVQGPSIIKDSGLGGMLLNFALLTGILLGSIFIFVLTTTLSAYASS